jgi:4-amino-4-deoxy-L-arabinose transferase-like glycosyltransferase
MQRFALRPAALAALLIAIGAIRMAATFRVFSATSDEATHIGAGLEMYQFHRYQFQRENPPLPRLVMAIAPYLGGMRYDDRGNFPEQIHSIFYSHGEYRANLVRARVGNLVFFVIAAVALFFLARDAIGDTAALLALLLFTMEPIVLGYSAVATHDAAAVAGVAVALLAFTRWLRDRNLSSALLFGAATASAFSANSPASRLSQSLAQRSSSSVSCTTQSCALTSAAPQPLSFRRRRQRCS